MAPRVGPARCRLRARPPPTWRTRGWLGALDPGLASPPPAAPGARFYAGEVAPVLASLGSAPVSGGALLRRQRGHGGQPRNRGSFARSCSPRAAHPRGPPGECALGFRLQRALHARGVLSEARMEAARSATVRRITARRAAYARRARGDGQRELRRRDVTRAGAGAPAVGGRRGPRRRRRAGAGPLRGGATLRVLERVAHSVRPRRPTSSPPTPRGARVTSPGRRAERGPRGGAHRPARALAEGPAA